MLDSPTTDNAVRSINANSAAAPARLLIYGAVNVGFLIFLVVASALGSNPNPRLLYLVALFLVCSSPLLVFRRLNDQFAIYTIFLGIYFVSYGMLDVISLVSKVPVTSENGALTLSELLIIAGGLSFVVGYRAVVAARKHHRDPPALADDWPLPIMISIGLFMWGVGTYTVWHWYVDFTEQTGQFQIQSSPFVTMLLMIGHYVQPLGVLIIAYCYTISRSKFLLLITIAVVCIQVVVGFISNTKSGAMQGGILVIVTSLLVTGKVPKMWFVALLAFIFLAFPVFQAYRTIVVGQRGMSSAQAAKHIGEALRLSLENEKLVSSDFGGAQEYHSQSFFERSSVKSAIDMIVSGTANGVPYEHGYTLIPLLTAFIPRVIWSDKLDVQTGQLVNRAFQVTSEAEYTTYISPSHLGEMYWNFGWIGGIAGMLLLGMLLGWINCVCDLSQIRSVSRLLIMAITILELCVRFEASIASEYSVWLRSVVGILILNMLLAKRARGPSRAGSAGPGTDVAIASAAAAPFPNLMR